MYTKGIAENVEFLRICLVCLIAAHLFKQRTGISRGIDSCQLTADSLSALSSFALLRVRIILCLWQERWS